MIRVLSPAEAQRAFELGKSSYRPKAITDLQDLIDGKIRVAELHASIKGFVDPKEIEEIVNLKLKKDGLYGDWVQGKIE